MNLHAMHKQDGREVYLTTEQAAKLLPATSSATLRRWAGDGLVPVVRLPSGRMLFRQADIENLLVPTTESAPSASSAQSASSPVDQPLPGFEDIR